MDREKVEAMVAARAAEPMEFGKLWRELMAATGIDTRDVLRWLIGYEVEGSLCLSLAAMAVKLGVGGDVIHYQKRASELRSEADAARHGALPHLGESDVARGALG